MIWYILRRFLQMIPTVLGVIVVTFVLFNVVGGSPARMTLGKHATPRTLEDYDELRGFNRPLLFGWWTGTRAYEDSDFSRGAGPWAQLDGVIEREPEGKLPARIALPPGNDYVMPLAFPLRSDLGYRVVLDYRTAADSEVTFVVRRGIGVNAVETEPVVLDPTRGWKQAKLDVPVQPEEPPPVLVIRVANTDMEVKSARLLRKVDNPFQSQLAFYLMQIATFDFGRSSSTNQRVSTLLLSGVVPSLLLTVPIFVIGVVVAISLALVCAFFRNRFIDRFFVVLSVALMSINYLVFIILGQFLLAYKLEWFPIWGFESWRYLLLPVIIGVVSGLGGSLRFYRTVVLDEMYKDYVRTAFAKGVSKRVVLFRHVLKNAMVPILTNVIIAIPFLYTGSLLLETFFGIPGLGYLAINAINSSDVDVIRAIVLIGSILFVLANLATDLCYVLVDPRVKLP